MGGDDKRLGPLAVSLARMLEDWPEMTLEDARSLCANSRWAYKEIRFDELSAQEPAKGPGGPAPTWLVDEAWAIAKGSTPA